MEKKKIIFGISSFAGSNTTFILEIIELLLGARGIRIKLYSLKNHSCEKIVELMKNECDERTVYVIKHIRTISDLNFLIASFGSTFSPVGIEVPWEQCFKNFQDRGDLPEDADPNEWRTKDKEERFRNDILACFKEIGTRNDNLYLCQPEAPFEIIGRLTDTMLLKF